MYMKQFTSAIREALRTTIIALIPVVIIQIEAGAVDMKMISVTLIIGLLRGIEKFAHEMDVTTGLEFKSIK